MNPLRIRVEVDPMLVVGLPSECVDVLARGVRVSLCSGAVLIEGTTRILATSLSDAVESLHRLADLFSIAYAAELTPEFLAWRSDCAMFYRLVAELLVQRHEQLWPS